MLYADLAEKYLEKFVMLSKLLYEETSLILNMHNLKHLGEDVKHFGYSLTDTSAYPFENLLGKLKKHIHCGKKPLAQLCRRLEEEHIYNSSKQSVQTSDFMILKKTKYKNETKIIIHRLKYYDSEITVKKPNNVVLLKNNKIFQISHIYCNEDTQDLTKIHIDGKEISIIKSGSDYPLDSAQLNIFQVKNKPNSENMHIFLSDVLCKLMHLSIFELPDDQPISFVIPLLHMN